MSEIGWIGSILLSFCGLPQMILSIKNRRTDGVSSWFLWLWFLGEIFTFIYVLSLTVVSIQLITNYSLNIIFLTVIIYYKYFPNKI